MAKRSHYLAATAGAVALALGGAALVHAAAPPAPPAGAEAASPGANPDWQAMRAQMQARHAARAKLLHDALNLKPGQEAAWTTFQAAIQPPAGAGPGMGRGGWMNPQGAEGLTTPERLDRMAERMDQMTAFMASRRTLFVARANAVKTFYAVLEPAQKRTFDAFAAQGLGGMGMMGGGMMGGGFGMGRGGGYGMGPGMMGPPPGDN